MAETGAWPVEAKELADLPKPVGDDLSRQLATDERVLRLCYVPADPSPRGWVLWRQTKGVQVLAVTDSRLLIGSGAPGQSQATWFAAEYDRALAWGIMESLLYGRLEVRGWEGERCRGSSLEFNTVGLALIERTLHPLGSRVLGPTGRERPAQRPSLVGLGAPLRFQSRLLGVLLPGEAPARALFEDTATVPYLRFWRRLLRPAQLVASTALRLLVIRDEPDLGDYAWSWTSLPRRWATDLEFCESEGTLEVRYAPAAELLAAQVAARRGDELRALVESLRAAP